MVKTKIKIKELYQSQRKGFTQPVSFALMATALSSCGGGGGGSGSSTQNVNYTGAVVKGPLQNALVFLDTNGNNIKDASEVSVLTDAKGNYSFSAPSGSYNLIATTTSNTIDTSSGEILDGVTFKAPKSSSIISPITTVMVETGLSKEKVSESLGISGVDILTFNPFDEGVDEQKALSMEKVSHQTLLTINAISSAAKDSGIDEDKAFELGMSAFSKKIIEINNSSSSTVIDLSNENTIDDFITVAKTVIKDAGGDENIFQQVSETLADNVKTNNKKISDLNDLDSTDAKTAFANSAKITKLVEEAIKELDLETVISTSSITTTAVTTTSPTPTTSSTQNDIKIIPKTQAILLFDKALLKDKDMNEKIDHIENFDLESRNSNNYFEKKIKNSLDFFRDNKFNWSWDNAYFTSDSIIIITKSSQKNVGIEFKFNSNGISLNELLDVFKEIEKNYGNLSLEDNSSDNFSAITKSVSLLDGKIFEKVVFWDKINLQSNNTVSFENSTEIANISVQQSTFKYSSSNEVLFQISGSYETNWEKLFQDIISNLTAYDKVSSLGWEFHVNKNSWNSYKINNSKVGDSLNNGDLAKGQPIPALLDSVENLRSNFEINELTVNPGSSNETKVEFSPAGFTVLTGEYSIKLDAVSPESDWNKGFNEIDLFLDFLDDSILSEKEQSDIVNFATNLSGPQIEFKFGSDTLLSFSINDLGKLISSEISNPNLKMGDLNLEIVGEDAVMYDGNNLLSVVFENANMSKTDFNQAWTDGSNLSISPELVSGKSNITDVIKAIAFELNPKINKNLLDDKWESNLNNNSSTDVTPTPTAQGIEIEVLDNGIFIFV